MGCEPENGRSESGLLHIMLHLLVSGSVLLFICRFSISARQSSNTLAAAMRVRSQLKPLAPSAIRAPGERWEGVRTDVDILLRTGFYMRSIQFLCEFLALFLLHLSRWSVRKSRGVGDKVERGQHAKPPRKKAKDGRLGRSNRIAATPTCCSASRSWSRRLHMG